MPQLFFKRDLQQAIREGRKVTTIRRWDRPLLAVGQQAFSPGLGWLLVEAVEVVELESLSDDHARADGFETKVLLVQALREFYPYCHQDQKQWFLIRFSLHRPQARRVRDSAVNEQSLF